MRNQTDILCPTSCPFLEVRSFLPNSIPFYCSKYNSYLGMNPSKHVQKCSLCLGINQDILQTGLSLLDAQPTHTMELKQAFLNMQPKDQRFLVDFLSKQGSTLSFKRGQRITPVLLLTEILRLHQAQQKYEKSPEAQEFLNLLKLISDSGTPMAPATRTLLSNLFQVIDASEKGMLLAILENPSRLKSFLKQFSKIPQNQNMLKNFRALLYEMDRQRDNMNQITQLPLHIHHMMQKMTQVRLKKQNQRSR